VSDCFDRVFDGLGTPGAAKDPFARPPTPQAQAKKSKKKKGKKKKRRKEAKSEL